MSTEQRISASADVIVQKDGTFTVLIAITGLAEPNVQPMIDAMRPKLKDAFRECGHTVTSDERVDVVASKGGH